MCYYVLLQAAGSCCLAFAQGPNRNTRGVHSLNFRSFFESFPAASYIADSHGTLLACNLAFAKFFGFQSRDEACSHGLASLYPDQHLPEFLSQLHDLPLYAEQKLRRVDGTPIYALAAARGVFNRHGHLRRVMGFYLDKSQVQVSERNLSEMRMLEALARFSGHIVTFLDDLLWIAGDQLSMSEDVSTLEDVSSRFGRVSQIRLQLKAFSQLQTSEPAPLNLNALLVRLSAMIARNLPDETKLEFKLSPDLDATMADQDHLEQVILELVTNARDAMPTPGRVVFKTENVTATGDLNSPGPIRPGNYTLLRVSDNGIGMEVSTRERAFDPFFTGRFGRAGLGLPAVHGLVRQCGGDIHIDSAPDQGTAISIFLPRTNGQPSYHDTVLIVEDDASIREQLVSRFKDAGFTTLVAENGLEACRVASRHSARIDVLITECAMPKMSGPDLAERILLVRPGIQIVFLTPALDIDLNETVKRLHAHVVVMPSAAAAVVACVEALLCRPKMIRHNRPVLL